MLIVAYQSLKLVDKKKWSLELEREKGMRCFTKLINDIIRSKNMPNEWWRNALIPIFKNISDIQNCTNYRGIKHESYHV